MASRITVIGAFVLGLGLGVGGMAGFGYFTDDFEAAMENTYYPCAPRVPDTCSALPETTAVENFCQFAGGEADTWSICQPAPGEDEEE